MPVDMDKIAKKLIDLCCNGIIIKLRDPRLNSKFPGEFMVVEEYTENDLPTEDGSNGPWCIVGDDLFAMIEEAHKIWCHKPDGK